MRDFIDTSEKRNSNILRINFERESILVNPDYQRNGDIWTLEKRQLLIDSILNDFDIPKIYFHVLSAEKTSVTDKEYAIIDGRQRLEAIWKFIDGDYALSDDFKYFKNKKIRAGGMSYKDLSTEYPELKMIFDSYDLPIMLVQTDDVDLIDDMFLRLNEAVPLNAAEKRNAIRGSMATAINNLARHTFFTKCVKFGNKRYQHKEVAARLLFLLHSLNYNKRIIDTKKAYLDEFVRQYKVNKNIKAKPILSAAIEILDEMAEIFLEKDPLLSSQGAIPIYFLLFKDFEYVIKRRSLVKFREDLNKNKIIAEENISEAKFELLEFDRLSQQGTNDASSIKIRTQIITDYLK